MRKTVTLFIATPLVCLTNLGSFNIFRDILNMCLFIGLFMTGICSFYDFKKNIYIKHF